MAVKLNLAEDLKDFSQATKEKKYKRISYDTWKDLKHLSDLPDCRVAFDGEYIYYKESAEDTRQCLVLCGENASFRHFLRDKYHFSACDTNTTTAINSSNIITNETATSAYAYGTIAVPLGDYTITATVKKKKENNKMFGVNFDFGSCSGDNIRMSMYGLAVKNTNGEWVSYNNGSIINVDAFNFDGSKLLFKMPVPLEQVAVGDVVIHNRVPMFVEEVFLNDRKSLMVTDPRGGERKEIVPTQSPFGFNFITKVVSLFAATQSLPSAEQPFGNMLPFMLCGDEDPTAAMAMMMMMNGNQKMDMTNPMMMYMLMKDSNNENMLPLLMMNMNK